MKCENCNNDHDGSYGSGRFCSSKCARGFSTKAKRKEINENVSLKMKDKPSTGKPFIKGYDERRDSVHSNDAKNKRLETNRKRLDDKYRLMPFDELPLSRKRVFILNEQNGSCDWCGISKWRDIPVILELDHINGDNSDNRRDNLRMLCPNCHSKTDTFRGKNIGNRSNIKVSDDVFIKALSENKSIRAALIEIGLTPKGGNYVRAKRLLKE